jgi:hypothetical protein
VLFLLPLPRTDSAFFTVLKCYLVTVFNIKKPIAQVELVKQKIEDGWRDERAAPRHSVLLRRWF